ncbi:MAG: DegT/DnrJ/EryC1/StrS family aminotransferase [Candidatus Brockarchaeota archaeon]|nr:DegT/DnrJ/EryC1/StrS family aminotransferase [Candidatus Brockarchaeota archaeon]
MSKLAIEGGTPVRRSPFPNRKAYGLEEARQVIEALDSQDLFFATGRKVYQFLSEFKSLYGVKHATASNSGTSAIHVALGALNLEPGDEVITTPVSDMGTVAPILLQNCIPVFADVELGTCNLDPDDVEKKITERTRAIIVVHCWGQPADMDRFLSIAKKRGLRLIEDCAQAHFAHYKGRLAGTIGDLGAFSFQQSKHMTCGDGGITITNDEELGKRADLFADKGCDWTEDRRYRLRYAFLAPCYRMTELQGAVLLAQLKKLRWVAERRQQLGDRLTESIKGLDGVYPPERAGGVDHRYWGYPIRVDGEKGLSRDKFVEALVAEGVPAGKAWPGKPLYLYEMLQKRVTYGSSGYPFTAREGKMVSYDEGLCPNAERVEREMCTVWINEFYSEGDIDDISEAVRKVASLLPRN